ncbi:MAG TPA: LapA family protein [Methylomirabilota bacterium]|nr:LapA family protein [Methylomirabilota bacterium]
MIVIYLLMALVGSVATLFAAQNIDPVVIRFLVWRIEGMPLALVILLSLLVGVIFASLSGAVRHWRLRSRVRQLENQLAQLTAARPPQDPAPPV